ncbi:hypothetical protein XELAEV_18045526mg [Xenopus laevis]|uniref:Uncharacterized protein n=1 Tax=Xenopus laevis TaxID=8355 RepID=A0A974H4B9_XENLA|nr:hypothetical protein XELAEV_18045526mg [Xenopus laevis]
MIRLCCRRTRMSRMTGMNLQLEMDGSTDSLLGYRTSLFILIQIFIIFNILCY